MFQNVHFNILMFFVGISLTIVFCWPYNHHVLLICYGLYVMVNNIFKFLNLKRFTLHLTNTQIKNLLHKIEYL